MAKRLQLFSPETGKKAAFCHQEGNISNLMTTAVVIPAYQESLSFEEDISLNRTLQALGEYPIVIVCPKDLNPIRYHQIAEQHKVSLLIERFDNVYFKGISGYNQLLLSASFYRRFQAYDYILICQLDAFVFRDELKEWCNKGYDYIGAPIIGKFTDTEFSTDMRVGNGGLSLRRVSAFLDFFDGRKNVFSSKQIVRCIDLWKKPTTRVFVWLFMVMGWRNRPLSVSRRWKYNEDDFWSGLLDHSNYAMNKPTPQQAIRFSFERFPSELYEINDRHLPFGCHAWRKYQYNEFWIHHIHI